MSEEYDARKDAHDSYFLAIETKRLRGDTHDWEKPPEVKKPERED